MLILPYIRLSPHCVRLLTVGGSCLWSEDDGLEVERDILEPNGIVVASPPRTVCLPPHTLVICEVDPHRTAVNDFYMWSDVSYTDRETFSWRTVHDLECVPPPLDAMLDPLPLGDVLRVLREAST